MELLKLTKHGYNGAIIAHIYDNGCFINRAFYGYSINGVFAQLRALGCVCSNGLKRIAKD